MAITVTWGTRVINVPKNDMTLIQSDPTEIRELNLNSFRLTLKDLEDGVEGMPFPDTHNHNTEVSLGGLTYARVVEIINGYTVTFEDGAYAVNLVGANSNVGDNVNVNQVSVRSQNSAGLISSPDIEYASFNGGVTIDTTTSNTGTIFPAGTEQKKVNNIADALLIAAYRGFNKLYIHSDLEIGSNGDLANFVLEGQSHVKTNIDILTYADVTNVTIVDCNVSGILDGNSEIRKCVIENLQYVNGHIHDSGLSGIILLDGNMDAYIANCTQVDMNIIPIIDMGGSGQDLLMPNYTGFIRIENLTSSNRVGISMTGGRVVLDSTTITNGIINVGGIGKVEDESGNPIITGTWNGGVTVVNNTIDASVEESKNWSEIAARNAQQ